LLGFSQKIPGRKFCKVAIFSPANGICLRENQHPSPAYTPPSTIEMGGSPRSYDRQPNPCFGAGSACFAKGYFPESFNPSVRASRHLRAQARRSRGGGVVNPEGFPYLLISDTEAFVHV